MALNNCLFFVGIKHSGKTTYASIIASRWNYEFLDSDDLILTHTKESSIRDLFKQIGKEAFMAIEAKCVEEYLEKNSSNLVLSLGGGASDNEKLLDVLKKHGRIIYLYRKEELILPIILKDGVPPFLDKNDISGSFHSLYQRRDNIYKDIANLVIDMGEYGDKGDIANNIEKILKENGYGV